MSSDIGKLKLPGQSHIDSEDTGFRFYIGKVVSVDDKNDGDRIYVRIGGVDKDVPDTDSGLMAFPLLPKMFRALPQVGESVFVFIREIGKDHANRFYLGPIISQPQFLEKDDHIGGSQSLLDSGAVFGPSPAPSTISDAQGIYPQKNETAVQGRYNSSVLFRPRQCIIRAGVFVEGNKLKYNSRPAYFKAQSNVNIDKDSNGKTTKGQVTVTAADKVLLLTYNGLLNKIKNYKISDPNTEITDDNLLDIIQNAYSAVYAEELARFVNILKKFAANHVHPYPGLPPLTNEKSTKDVIDYDTNAFIAKNIKLV